MGLISAVRTRLTRPPRPRRRSTAIAAGIVLGLIAVIAAVAPFLPDRTTTSDHPAAPAPPPSPSAPAPTEKAPTGQQALPITGPPVRWELVNGVSVPVSADAGPHRQTGPVAEDYQRSPVGALIAGIQIDTRHLFAPGQGWRQVTEQQVLPGPGRDAYIAARSQVSDPSVSSEQVAQIAGFRFVTYSPDLAVIQLATQQPDGLLIGTTVTVRWADNDWRLELQPTGATSPSAQPLRDLTQYTPWSGVR